MSWLQFSKTKNQQSSSIFRKIVRALRKEGKPHKNDERHTGGYLAIFARKCLARNNFLRFQS